MYCNELKVLAPLSIGFAVFMVHLTTIPITGIGINPARSFDAAVIYNKAEAWDDHVSTLSLLRLLIICIITKVVCLFVVSSHYMHSIYTTMMIIMRSSKILELTMDPLLYVSYQC